MFFTLFGCRIPIDPSSDATATTVLDCPHEYPSDAGAAHDLSPRPSSAIVAFDATPTTLPNYSTEEPAESWAVLSPEPLRMYNPYENRMHDISSSSSSTTGSKPQRKYKKRKPANEDDKPRPARNVRRRRREPLQPQNDLSPEFLRVISPARPLFLYRKRLEVSDVDTRQNRLLVTDTDRLKEFLTEEEMAKSKVDVTGVDEKGREYKMRLSKWGEKKKKKSSVVFNAEWTLMLSTNEVAIHHFVDVWGFRRDWKGTTNEFCLAVAFSRG